MFVYVLNAVGTARYKVGVTTEIAKRITALQTGCPFPLAVVNTIEGDATLEREMHSVLDKYRVVGEWFELPGKAAEFVRTADRYAVSRASVAQYLLSFGLEGAVPASKADEIRRSMSGVLDGFGI